jgi:ATP-dependent DNA helicase RecQ
MIEKIEKALQQYWGYNSFLPLQRQAIEHIGQGRDSIVVLPTGGGKSLCYQAPAVVLPGLTVVVSPLIALMKDQVDGLLECGVSAARIDSSLSSEEQRSVFSRLRSGDIKIIYVAPERLVMESFMVILQDSQLSLIAIDEAHCVSMWGHDFRPEYRQLAVLKKTFPKVPIGAYTATATEKVRLDISEQLCLDNPAMVIGSFDRPNLVYKVQPRTDRLKQVCAVMDRHKAESGIVYCIRRKDVDALCNELKAKGYRVAPYHAGMDPDDRKASQEKFIQEKVDTIVATIAFGMGIDKSNVRYVIHTGLPKSIEHYQQESGRAGRDGLEAECCLFYSAGDYGVWKSLMRDMEPQAQSIAQAKLDEMYGYCTGAVCRHKSILEYFGQMLDKEQCSACDICLGELDYLEDALVTGQKILSCILRLGERFGGDYTSAVLTGSREERILENKHDTVSTYGLLQDHPKKVVHDWIEQLVGQGYAQKTGEYNTLRVTDAGWSVLRGQKVPRLLKPAQKPAKQSKVARESWDGVDKGLFEELRTLRYEIASEHHLPAYVVFGDTTLRELARQRPSAFDALLDIKGIGEKKRSQYGQVFLNALTAYCQSHNLEMDL